MNDTSTDENNQGGVSSVPRRKRINRIKAVIIVAVIIFLLLPTFFCIFLSLQVNRLQKQMKELMDLHSEYGLVYSTEDENLAYAAEIPPSGLTGVPQDADDGAAENQESNSAEAVSKPENYTSEAAGIPESNNKEVTENPESISREATENPDSNNSEIAGKPKTDSGEAVSKAETDSNKAAGASEGNSGEDDTRDQAGIYAGKTVYLTFDDGPSIYTGDILDILDEYQVKATFFVIGKTDKASEKLYQRIVDEGHTLGMHSYSHRYDKIYNSVEDFDKDFTKLWKLLYDTTGYKPSIYRFPGGSDNLVNKHGMEEFIRYLNEASISYFDWNVVSGDATGVEYTKEQLIANVLGGVAGKKRSIVLMHDAQSKETTVESLPKLLDKLIAGGAQILPLDKDVTPIQMIRADKIK